MRKNLLVVFVLCSAFLFGFQNVAAKTKLSVRIYGYRGEMVYFDCMQSPFIKKEFHSNEGEEHTYSFDTKEFVCMVVNGKINLLLEPEDNLKVEIRYNGNKVSSIDFSGTPRAVANNQFYQDIRTLKKDMRYKKQLLGCVVLGITPKKRIDDSRVLLNKVKGMIKKSSKVSKNVANYCLAEVESDAYMSFMEYPVMYEEVRKVPLKKLEIGDYWKIMDGYKVREDVASLRNLSYANMLMRYCFYENEKKAVAKGVAYEMPRKFEGMYKELSAFYSGNVRDFVLYRLISNFIQGGKQIERADAIYKDYKEKYNKNKEYAKILDTLLQ